MGLNILQNLCIFMLLTIPTIQKDWQGTGNMSESNMTMIQTQISNYPITSLSDRAQINTVAMNISRQLNQAWDNAWNVVIVKGPADYDSVVYGYAFKDHWMWINGVPIASDSNKLAYIIWKDYNCHTWSKINTLSSQPSSFVFAQKQKLLSYSFTTVDTDVWGSAFGFVEFINLQSVFSSGAYTVIMSQSGSPSIDGYICLVDINYYERYGIQGSKGAYFIFQTR